MSSQNFGFGAPRVFLGKIPLFYLNYGKKCIILCRSIYKLVCDILDSLVQYFCKIKRILATKSTG